MADIKQFEIIPSSGPLGTKLFNFGDFPGGLSTSPEYIRPTYPRRSQDGTLVTQTLLYNKESVAISGVINDVLFHIYFKALYQSGITATLKLWYEDANYAEQTDFNALVNFLDYRMTKNENDNTYSVSMIFAEI